jgi:small nuclear ribonucleoprotein (snRNP)-like protein
MIERPLDMLNDLKGKPVIITLKEGDSVEGDLLAIDIHINLAPDYVDDDKKKKNLFVRGDTVVFVEGKDETPQ